MLREYHRRGHRARLRRGISEWQPQAPLGDGLLRGEGVPPLRVAGILPAIRGPEALVTEEQGQDALATERHSQDLRPSRCPPEDRAFM